MKTSTSGARPAAESPYDTVLRIGTGFMMSLAAALLLLHAHVYAAGAAGIGPIAPNFSTAGPH
jgi:hypothetical protein